VGEGDVACRVVSVGFSGDCLAVVVVVVLSGWLLVIVVCVESLAAGID
jgi:hypothetical protein